MPSEVTQFETNVADWLNSVAKFSGEVGGRVFNGEPMTPPDYPVAYFEMDREPASDGPVPHWRGALRLRMYGQTKATLNACEDALVEWLQDSGNAILTTLSTSGEVGCAHFQLARVSADQVVQDLREEAQYLVRERTLEFDFEIVALGET